MTRTQTIVAMLTVLTVTSIAHALPPVATPTPAPARVALEVGVAAGETLERDLYLGLTIGAGYRWTSWLWVHAWASIATAPVVRFAGADQVEGANNRLAAVRAGLEAHLCTRTAVFCGIAGIDLGYRYDKFTSRVDTQDRSGPAAIARLGLDFGSDVLRVRPVLEGTSTATADTTAFVLGLAYRQ